MMELPESSKSEGWLLSLPTENAVLAKLPEPAAGLGVPMYSRRQRYFSLTTLRRLRTAAKTYGLCSQPNAAFAKAIAYNFRLQQMFNCLHPDQVRCGGRIQCAENPRCIRITHYSRESTAKSWKRVRYAMHAGDMRKHHQRKQNWGGIRKRHQRKQDVSEFQLTKSAASLAQVGKSRS